MGALTQAAIENNASPEVVARTAVREAAEAAATESEKEALALSMYKEATGRFPQDSSDRRAVYMGGFVLAGLVFVVTVAVACLLIMSDKAIPDWLSTLATALVSGVIGGLFGYARQ